MLFATHRKEFGGCGFFDLFFCKSLSESTRVFFLRKCFSGMAPEPLYFGEQIVPKRSYSKKLSFPYI